MKNPFNTLGKKSRLIHLTAATLIVCMGLCDLSLYSRYLSGTVDGFQASSSDNDDVVIEEHEIEKALADGYYDGRGSDSANGISSSIKLVEGKHLFNILEILPTEKRGVIGYTIGGCEPFDVDDVTYNGRLTTKSELKQAYMDAMINPEPGTEQGNNLKFGTAEIDYVNILWEIGQKLAEGGSLNPFEFKTGNMYSGYYKYVGNNKGVYAIDNPLSSNPTIKSRFYTTGRSDFNYIFIYDDTFTGMKTALGDVKRINERRVQYINREKFIKECLGKDPSIKASTEFEVTTRTPVSVTLEDIERADLILINNANKPEGTKDHYYFALRLNNKLAGETNYLKDWYLHFYSPEDDTDPGRSNRIDFVDSSYTKKGKTINVGGFEKVIRIYERIVVREDCAIVCEKSCCTYNNGSNEIDKINTNLRKLMFMLFYVKADGEPMAGRDLFTDFFKRYTDEPGEEYLQKRIMHLADPINYPIDYRAAWLKRNCPDDPTNPNIYTSPEYYYMHMKTGNHVGHPLVVDKNACITGVETVRKDVNIGTEEEPNIVTVTLPYLTDGRITPLHDGAESMKLTIRTDEEGKKMFDDTGKFEYAGEHSDDDDWCKNNVDQMKYYKSGNEYHYQNCYNSMSNTTDYIYIDNDGRLIIDTKYSSDQLYNEDDYWKYWYKIDADFYQIDGNTFRRRKWGKDKCLWDVDEPWPWDSAHNQAYLDEWLMHRKTERDIYDCNMHMWYDYGADAKSYGGKVYMTVKSPPFGTVDNGKGKYHNQSLMEENAFFKGDFIKKAVGGREITRETGDINHTTTVTANYYYSMNIVNGDGVNVKNGDAAKKNKTLYYNQYESDKIVAEETGTDDAYIPINIEVKSSLKIKDIKVSGGGKSIEYAIANGDPDQDVIQGRKIGTGGTILNSLDLTRKTDLSGNPITALLADYTPYYTYNGSINCVLYDWYNSRRNTKIKVEMTVVLPDDTTEKTISDEITIVKRDFFMLD